MELSAEALARRSATRMREKERIDQKLEDDGVMPKARAAIAWGMPEPPPLDIDAGTVRLWKASKKSYSDSVKGLAAKWLRINPSHRDSHFITRNTFLEESAPQQDNTWLRRSESVPSFFKVRETPLQQATVGVRWADMTDEDE